MGRLRSQCIKYLYVLYLDLSRTHILLHLFYSSHTHTLLLSPWKINYTYLTVSP